MPSCGTCVAAALIRGKLAEVPPDVGYIVIPFTLLYPKRLPRDIPFSLVSFMRMYLETQYGPIRSWSNCKKHPQEPVPATSAEPWPCKRFRPQVDKPRNHFLVVPVFYLLKDTAKAIKLMPKFKTQDPLRHWTHIIPVEGLPIVNEDLGMEIVEYKDSILYTIANFDQPTLFNALLTTWPTLVSEPIHFTWGSRDYSDSLSVVLYGFLLSAENLIIAIRHGLDINLSPVVHVIDRLHNHAKSNMHTTSAAVDRFTMLITYGLTDFECATGTPMNFLLDFKKDQPLFGWNENSIINAITLMESVGYQYTLSKDPISIEKGLIGKWAYALDKVLLLKQHLHRISNRPLTLTEISRNKIRYNLGGSNLCNKATQLGLPPALVKVVTMQDIRNSLRFNGLKLA